MTETFDDPVAFAPERRIVSFQGVRFWSKDPSPPYWTVGDAEGATLYRKFSDGADTGDLAVSFVKDGDVRSFGFLLNPFGHPNQIAIRVVEVDGTVTLVLLPQNAGATYFGLHSRIGIEKVVIGQRPDLAGGWTNFSLDRVSRGHIMSGHH
ncbi:MAG TPA: hypothetical protein VHM65_00265 [Candidatus Lustribacter sp.]|nr:hypothetical protein [Candidatus Lustribacter sp.]